METAASSSRDAIHCTLSDPGKHRYCKNGVHKFSPHFHNIKLGLVFANSICVPFLVVFIFREKYKYKSV